MFVNLTIFHKLTVINLSKSQVFDIDLKTMQQNNFIGTSDQDAKDFFVLEETEEAILDFISDSL